MLEVLPIVKLVLYCDSTSNGVKQKCLLKKNLLNQGFTYPCKALHADNNYYCTLR